MHRISFVTGCTLAFLAIVLGAFGAHYLKTIFTPDILNSFETGVRYQMYHAFVLIILGIYNRLRSQELKIIYTLFFSGTVLFSGSIYLLSYFKSTETVGLTGLGILTPIGGILMLLGWLLLIIYAIKHAHFFK
ncbi:MAG: DUF423 domain-containing protein [Chitinophagaceae bacterium]